MTGWKPPGPSVLDDAKWPEQLVARAIDAGPEDDRLHGYAVLGDVARNYSFSDLMYLALVGDLPDARSSALFALALFAFATPGVAEAPVHIAVLAKMSGAPIPSALATGSITAAEQARVLVEKHADFLTWLRTNEGAMPAIARGDSVKVTALRDMAHSIDPRAPLHAEMSIDAARIALLYWSGVQSADQIVGAIVSARISAIAAECLATGPEHLRQYPIRLPEFRYVETDEEP